MNTSSVFLLQSPNQHRALDIVWEWICHFLCNLTQVVTDFSPEIPGQGQLHLMYVLNHGRNGEGKNSPLDCSLTQHLGSGVRQLGGEGAGRIWETFSDSSIWLLLSPSLLKTMVISNVDIYEVAYAHNCVKHLQALSSKQLREEVLSAILQIRTKPLNS